MSFISVSFKFSLSPQTRLPCRKSFISRSSPGLLNIRAVQENGGPRRLVDIIRLVPDISRNYFRSPSRRALFGGISLLGGFYVAQTISLSFGALGVNDVIAAVICVLLTEYVTRFYYSRPKVSLSNYCSESDVGFSLEPGETAVAYFVFGIIPHPTFLETVKDEAYNYIKICAIEAKTA
ncbi:hypothetical protein Gohar_005888 [Gossypium harknessii]|uniref:Uncharacterized protein n=1 Tax=Gossypium harknessii TaxID=34285 RepID=A0A7J9HAL1_9ROSI|nr:hypothetical protein [Gossypium harknessii]